MRVIHVSVLTIVVLAASIVAAAPAVLAPGRWEITIRTEAPVATPPMTTEVCITKQEAEKPEPPRGKPTDACKVSGGGLSGNVLAYTTKCARRNVNARFTFNGDQYEGVVEIKSDEQDVRQVYTARRIGDCPEDSAAGKHP